MLVRYSDIDHFRAGRTSLVGTYQMPVVPDTVVVAGRVGSSPAEPEDGCAGVWGVCAITDVETARAAVNTLIPNSRLIMVLSEGPDRTACAPTDESECACLNATCAPPVGHSSHVRTRSGPSHRKQRGSRLLTRTSLG